ncbi:IS3 family transposase [Ursidibacter sp. B-7004-1]
MGGKLRWYLQGKLKGLSPVQYRTQSLN